MVSGTPCHVGPPGSLLSLPEKELAASVFVCVCMCVCVFYFLFDQCYEILRWINLLWQACARCLERKYALKWKSCSHNQSDQRSLSVWSSVKFYRLEWCHWKLTVLLKLPLSPRIWQNTYVLLHSAEDQLNVMVYVWISKIIVALDFSPLPFRKPCTVLYLIWSLQQVWEREDRDYYLYFTDTVLSVCSNWRGLGYHPQLSRA